MMFTLFTWLMGWLGDLSASELATAALNTWTMLLALVLVAEHVRIAKLTVELNLVITKCQQTMHSQLDRVLGAGRAAMRCVDVCQQVQQDTTTKRDKIKCELDDHTIKADDIMRHMRDSLTQCQAIQLNVLTHRATINELLEKFMDTIDTKLQSHRALHTALLKGVDDKVESCRAMEQETRMSRDEVINALQQIQDMLDADGQDVHPVDTGNSAALDEALEVQTELETE
jgi:uncharacterized protein YabE (DUF348 family)